METDARMAAAATGSLGQEESPSRNLLRRRIVTDASCRVVDRKDYEPYGVEIRPATNSAGNTHQYTGHERDEASGLDYMHYRYHAANLGRFMKPDNVPGDLTTPQSWNLYAYALGSPVNFTDPTGHMVGQAWRGYTWASGDIAGAMGNHQQANGLGGGIGLGSHGLDVGFGPDHDSWLGLAGLVFFRGAGGGSAPMGTFHKMDIIDPLEGDRSIEDTDIRSDSAGDGYPGASRDPSRKGDPTGVHQGVDLSATEGTPVYAPVSGTVGEPSSYDGAGPINVRIFAQTSDGVPVRVGLSHLSASYVKPRDTVKQGVVVGTTGKPLGFRGEPHLHFGIKDMKTGRYIDPIRMIKDQGFNSVDPSYYIHSR